MMKKVWIRFMKIWKFILLIILILLTFSYAMFQGGFVSWFLFYSFLPFALYALCVAFYSLDDFTVKRQVRGRKYQANEKITITVTLKRRIPFPLLFVLVEDCLSKSMDKSVKENNNKYFLLLGFRKEFSFEYSIEKLPRGEHTLQAVRIMISDLLGLIEKEKHINLEEKILVYPTYEELMDVS